jgi:hypothetical protein
MRPPRRTRDFAEAASAMLGVLPSTPFHDATAEDLVTLFGCMLSMTASRLGVPPPRVFACLETARRKAVEIREAERAAENRLGIRRPQPLVASKDERW